MNRHFGVLICLTGAALALTGCEAVQSVGKSIESIEWPSFGLGASNDKQVASQGAGGSAVQPLLADLPENCPQLKVLGDLAQITQFSKPKAPSPDTMIASAKLSGVEATCQVAPNSVTLEIALDFDGTLGPVGKANGASEANYTYPYFLSVVAPNGQIMSKDVFALSMVYTGGEGQLHKQDRLRQTIPLASGQAANQFQIVAGFQLSEDELSYNRTAP